MCVLSLSIASYAVRSCTAELGRQERYSTLSSGQPGACSSAAGPIWPGVMVLKGAECTLRFKRSLARLSADRFAVNSATLPAEPRNSCTNGKLCTPSA